jgi:hypothetical protein
VLSSGAAARAASERRLSASWLFLAWSWWMRSSTVPWQMSLWTKTGWVGPMRSLAGSKS